MFVSHSWALSLLIHFPTNKHNPSQRFQQTLVSAEGTACQVVNNNVHTIRAVLQELFVITVTVQWICYTIVSHCIMLPWRTGTKDGNRSYWAGKLGCRPSHSTCKGWCARLPITKALTAKWFLSIMNMSYNMLSPLLKILMGPFSVC